MPEQINFVEIKDKCPVAYDIFKKFLMKYEFGNFCLNVLETYESSGMEALKIDHQVSVFFGWLDKFFEENGIFVNMSLVQNSRLDKDQVEHSAVPGHFTEITDTVGNCADETPEQESRVDAFKEGYTEAFLILEERL